MHAARFAGGRWRRPPQQPRRGVAREVSRIGGHKLAPTAVHLPSGQTFGRLTEDDAVALATADTTDALPPALASRAKHRGRVDLAPAERVAETWWREAHPALPPRAAGTGDNDGEDI